MRNGQINSLSEIDMEHLSFEDIRWRYGVFHPTSTGAGRDKQYSAWIGVQTSLGEIEKGVWYQAAEASGGADRLGEPTQLRQGFRPNCAAQGPTAPYQPHL